MMSVDYIVASLPPLAFGDKPLIAPGELDELASGRCAKELERWRDLETQLRNAVAKARGGAKYAREAVGCSLYWRERVAACFQEKDVLKRDEMLDRVWWDAAGELVPPSSPLGTGALAAYRVRLGIAVKRAAISTGRGNAVFEKTVPGKMNVNKRETI